VPRVLGQTEKALGRKIVDRGEPRRWNEASFFLDLSQRRGEQEAAVARRLLEWATKHNLRFWWGEGKKDGSFFPMLACPPKPGPVLMGIVQLAESQGAIHAKTTQTGPDRGYPPRLPSRPRRRLEHQPCLPQGRDRTHHLLPLEGPPGGPRIE